MPPIVRRVAQNADVMVGVAIALCLSLYLALALSPSSYQIGLKYLGIEAKPLLGVARAIRSDEWIVYTPLVQIAVKGGFSAIDLISPYRESLKSFIALPIFDWSLIVKPQLWGYWLLPPAFAYSLFFGLMWSAFLLGYFILLRQLRVSGGVAFFTSLAFFSSHLVQVWWTNNAPAFALAPWPAIIFLSPLPLVPKALLLAWVTAVWAFGLVYPPFQIPAAFALAIMVLAFRRDAFTRANLAAAAVAAAMAGGVFYLYFSDLIQVIAATVYPGQRQSGGGNVPLLMALANFLPYITTANFVPLLPDSNECEIAAVTTFIPLLMATFARYETLREKLADLAPGLVIAGMGLAMMAAWMLLPVPASVGRFLLWTYVPPARMLFGFGLLGMALCAVVGSRLDYEVTSTRVMLLVLVLLAAALTSKLLLPPQVGLQVWGMFRRMWFDWAAIGIVLAFALCCRFGPGRPANVRVSVFATAALIGLATFGTFNPFQPAHAIFNLPDSSVQSNFKAEAARNPNGWLVVPGMYGALLNGAGIPAINHTLPVPQLAFFRRFFPDLSEEAFNLAFNRYAHIVPREDAGVPLSKSDVVFVPMAPFEAAVKGAP